VWYSVGRGRSARDGREVESAGVDDFEGASDVDFWDARRGFDDEAEGPSKISISLSLSFSLSSIPRASTPPDNEPDVTRSPDELGYCDLNVSRSALSSLASRAAKEAQKAETTSSENAPKYL
jgi:hypothetical protein